MKNFRAFRIHNEDGRIRSGIEALNLDDLSPGEVVIRAAYSSINFKDALAATGKGRILRRFPLVGGIDVSGVVDASSDERFAVGDEVLVTGCGLSEQRDGGFAEYVRVPADITVPLPVGLTLYEAMALGTAGFTAGLALLRMEENGQRPDMGPILVSGASGGVGSLAIDVFAGRGYRVTAVSGKKDARKYLKTLGASQVIAPRDLEMGKRPLEKARWGGAVDTVGGEMLAWLTRTVEPWGNIASIGLAGGSELETTVMPFILRGVSLLGVSSANCPYELRRRTWERLAGELHPGHLDTIVTDLVTLEQMPAIFERMLEGGLTGRTVVRIL